MSEDVPQAVVLDGRYRLGDRIGRGGMADVYRANDLQRGCEVAVKVFRPEVAEAVDPKRIARETRFLAGADHPTLVSVLGASGPASPTAYLVMELVPGTDLAERLQLGPLAVEHARRVVADVADALALLHARGLTHRDVKPANILVLEDVPARRLGIAAKLTDLGIAVGLDETRLTATNTILGTAAYLSPEQVQGEGVGPSSDVYALGLVLIESLTGERAYPGGLAESAVARLNRPPRLPESASAELASLLARMTALDPASRPTAAEVAAALTGMREGMTGSGLPSTAPLPRAPLVGETPTAELVPPPAASRRRARLPRLLGLAAAAAAAIVLSSGLGLLDRPTTHRAAAEAPASSVPLPSATHSAPTVVGKQGGTASTAVRNVALVSRPTGSTAVTPAATARPSAPKRATSHPAEKTAPSQKAASHKAAPHRRVSHPAAPHKAAHHKPAPRKAAHHKAAHHKAAHHKAAPHKAAPHKSAPKGPKHGH